MSALLHRRRRRLLLLMAHGVLLTLVVGFVSLERKFTRKPKQAPERLAPLIGFQDYTRTLTPLDRYRKHYVIFDYWNDELLNALQERNTNPKRYQHASAESLNEMKTLATLLNDASASGFSPLIDERERLDRQLQSAPTSSGLSWIGRQLDAQTRQVHRAFYWRRMEELLKPWPESAEAAPPAQAPLLSEATASSAPDQLSPAAEPAARPDSEDSSPGAAAPAASSGAADRAGTSEGKTTGVPSETAGQDAS